MSKQMTWWDYVGQYRSGDNDTQTGAKIGIGASSVYRWRKSSPDPANVRAFAEAYGRPVLEAFVAAGFLTSEQAGQQVIRQDISALTDDELVAEVAARLSRGVRDEQEPQQGTGAAPGSSEGSGSERQSGAPIGDLDERRQNAGTSGSSRGPRPAGLEKAAAYRGGRKTVQEERDRQDQDAERGDHDDQR